MLVIQKVNDRGDGNTFNDINFSASRPQICCTLRPKGGPGGTAFRHVYDVEHIYGVIPRFLGGNADTISPTCSGIKDVFIVCTHEKNRANC